MNSEATGSAPEVELGTIRLTGAELAGIAGVFLALAVLFMGRALSPGPDQVLGGYDIRGYYYPLDQAVRGALADGRLPLWSPYLFNGFPLLTDPQVNTFYPPAWLMLILPLNVGFSWYMLLHIWLAGMGMFLLVHTLGGRNVPAMAAGIIFAYSGLLAGRLWAGHSIVYAIDAWTPWMLLALAWSIRRGTWPAAVVAGTTFGLALLAGHLPSFLSIGLIWAAFAGYLLWNGRERRSLVLRQGMIMAAVGVAMAAVQLIPFLHFILTSARLATADFQFATGYSLPPAHLITLLVPQFFGEPTQVGYWSVPTFEELTYYAGVLVFLGIALTLTRPTRLGWFYLGLMLLGMWLALGRYGLLYELFFNWLPPFRVVRAPARAAFLYTFSAAALLGHTLSRWRSLPQDERRVVSGWLIRWLMSVWAVAGVAALAAAGATFMVLHPTDTSGRLWQQVGGYAQAVVIFLLGCGLVAAYLNDRPGNRARRRVIGVALLLLVTVDMWLFSYKFVRLEPVSPDAFWVDARAVIDDLEGVKPGERITKRVLPWGVSVFMQNGGQQVGLPSMFGYNPLEPAAHHALTSSVPDPRSTAYDLLSAAYVLSESPQDQFTEGLNGLELAGQQGSTWVYRRPAALPVTRLLYDVEVISDDQAAVDRVHQPEFNPAATAILAKAPPCTPGPAPETPGTVNIVEASDGYWRLATSSPAPALLVLAESAISGWKATVDGMPAEPLTAYTTIRAVCVPAGEHDVIWHFEPGFYLWGAAITLLSLLLVGASLVHLLRRP